MKGKKNVFYNPFRFGVVVDDSAFCNRVEEIAFLKSQIINGYSTWLFSPRRFGKTSLVEKVFRETRDTKCLYFDLYNISSKDDFCRRYSNIIAKELFNWKEDINKLTRDLSEAFKRLYPVISFDESGNPSFSMNLNKIEEQEDIETILDVPNRIAQKTQQRICIAFDEFQEINRIDSFMLHWMRSSFQRHRNISYIFLGSKQSLMEHIFSSPQAPFYEFAVKMNLSVIEREELYSFIHERFNNASVPIQDKTIHTILDKSENQPHFTQYFASVVFDLVKAGADQGDEDFTAVWMNKIIHSQGDIFQDMYDQLTNSQRAALQAISRLGEEGIYSEEARTKFGLPVSSSLNEALKTLQKKGMIYKVEHSFRIANPVFKEWVINLV